MNDIGQLLDKALDADLYVKPNPAKDPWMRIAIEHFNYQDTLEAVRQLAEGLAYRPPPVRESAPEQQEMPPQPQEPPAPVYHVEQSSFNSPDKPA